MNNNLVINNNGVATTTSLKVAEAFNKKHKHILEKIEKLLLEINEPNFGLVKTNMFIRNFYIDTKGEKRSCYNITRDGFTLLAMGFTGKKALEFKLKYIEAFNMMEAKLKELNNQPDFETTLTTVKQHKRKLPTVRVKKELTLPKDVYKNIGGVVKVVVKSEMEKSLQFLREPELKFNQPTQPSKDTDLTAFDKKELFNDKKRDELMKQAKNKLLSMIDEFCQFQNQIAEVTGAIKYNIYLKKNHKKAK